MQLPQELAFLSHVHEKQRRSTSSCKGKHVVITGATSGVGKAATWRFAQGGAQITLVVRDKQKAEALIQEIQTVYPVPMDYSIADFSDLQQVRKAAQSLHAPIDILIHSVGIHLTRKTLVKEGVDTVFLVNHLAPFLFTSLLIPILLESSPCRVIYVNSEGHRFFAGSDEDRRWLAHRYTGLRSYGAAKTAQLLTIWEFADQLKNAGITVNAMHPGAVKSNIGHENGLIYRWYAKYLLAPFLKDPGIAAGALYYLATAEELSGTTGKFFNQTLLEMPAAHALDRSFGKRVWQESRHLVGI